MTLSLGNVNNKYPHLYWPYHLLSLMCILVYSSYSCIPYFRHHLLTLDTLYLTWRLIYSCIQCLPLYIVNYPGKLSSHTHFSSASHTNPAPSYCHTHSYVYVNMHDYNPYVSRHYRYSIVGNEFDTLL
jgi:hypothetical protein